ncbi:MAG: hypothetical protein P4L20_06580 [Acidimicrobiales bacterium]|nr:hypothetical protein [Acidimicrobiales bacterium]
MPVREIASLVWDRRNDDIEVIYVGRDPEHFFGSEDVAIALALNAGLVAVPTPDGIRRWVSGG